MQNFIGSCIYLIKIKSFRNISIKIKYNKFLLLNLHRLKNKFTIQIFKNII